MPRSASLLAAAAFVAGATLPRAALAQGPMGPPPMGQPPMGGPGGGGAMMQRLLFEGITLSPAQQARVDSIQQARAAAGRARMEAMRAGGPPDDATRATMMRERRAAMEQDRAAMRALLTADQQPVFDANVARMQERMQERMRERMGPGGPGGPGPGPGGRD